MRFLLIALMMTLASAARAEPLPKPLPKGFVWLVEIDPTIAQDMRYAGPYNFTGKRVPGYAAKAAKAGCILTEAAAVALSRVQTDLLRDGYGLKVFDCYRPARAVRAFVDWIGSPGPGRMKAAFHPRVAKQKTRKLGYISGRSAHSRGSTVDLTLVKMPPRPGETYRPGGTLKDCTAATRFDDGGLDMGTGYDCLDPRAHTKSPLVSAAALSHRRRLVAAMARHGFRNYRREWWHFTLNGEPFPKRAFDFPVTAPD